MCDVDIQIKHKRKSKEVNVDNYYNDIADKSTAVQISLVDNASRQ